MFLKLSQIHDFLHGDIMNGNINEAEELLKFGHIVTVGCTKTTKVGKQIRGSVLQTSNRSSLPHTIEGFLKITKKTVKIEKMQCSCIVGLSGCCKHVVAILLFMERTDINELEDVSCIESKPVRNLRKNSTRNKFATADDFALKENLPQLSESAKSFNSDSALSKHSKGHRTEQTVNSDEDEIFKKNVLALTHNGSSCKTIQKVEKLPVRSRGCRSGRTVNRDKDEIFKKNDSAIIHYDSSGKSTQKVTKLSEHAKNYGTAQAINNDKDEILKKNISAIMLKSLSSETIQKVVNLPLIQLRDCCSDVLKGLIVPDPSKLCYETAKHFDLWKKARQLRMSGSRIYSVYTYCKNKNPNWEHKSKRYFWPIQLKNKFVIYGLEQEKFARVAYEKLFNVNVVECGLIVHPDCPWVGYSPDGIVFKNNVPELLIEIKCVYAGKSKSIHKCLASCAFLQDSNTLKQKHAYHGQVQLGMLLLNVKKCDFVLYASFDKSVHVIRVDFDEIFALEMISSVRKVYMEKMVHFICLKTEKNKQKE